MKKYIVLILSVFLAAISTPVATLYAIDINAPLPDVNEMPEELTNEGAPGEAEPAATPSAVTPLAGTPLVPAAPTPPMPTAATPPTSLPTPIALPQTDATGLSLPTPTVTPPSATAAQTVQPTSVVQPTEQESELSMQLSEQEIESVKVGMDNIKTAEQTLRQQLTQLDEQVYGAQNSLTQAKKLRSELLKIQDEQEAQTKLDEIASIATQLKTLENSIQNEITPNFQNTKSEIEKQVNSLEQQVKELLIKQASQKTEPEQIPTQLPQAEEKTAEQNTEKPTIAPPLKQHPTIIHYVLARCADVFYEVGKMAGSALSYIIDALPGTKPEGKKKTVLVDVPMATDPERDDKLEKKMQEWTTLVDELEAHKEELLQQKDEVEQKSNILLRSIEQNTFLNSQITLYRKHDPLDTSEYQEWKQPILKIFNNVLDVGIVLTRYSVTILTTVTHGILTAIGRVARDVKTRIEKNKEDAAIEVVPETLETMPATEPEQPDTQIITTQPATTTPAETVPSTSPIPQPGQLGIAPTIPAEPVATEPMASDDDMPAPLEDSGLE
ncbi:MAG: hypothetical protein H6679_05425 [Epsilonproteobacteria bacterium]|nr:hypothetical protein [Campylobacterota bacterium]